MTAWTYMEKRSTNYANSALNQADALLQPLAVLSIGPSADIFIDGISGEEAPQRCISSKMDTTYL